mmetsp:Transcript_20825/g.79838  ORF Transcript_20825/g.79838 Transcript_20825/m.79838 type:complete len:254 (+) Transcript_20825:626-1387(+)
MDCLAQDGAGAPRHDHSPHPGGRRRPRGVRWQLLVRQHKRLDEQRRAPKGRPREAIRNARRQPLLPRGRGRKRRSPEHACEVRLRGEQQRGSGGVGARRGGSRGCRPNPTGRRRRFAQPPPGVLGLRKSHHLVAASPAQEPSQASHPRFASPAADERCGRVGLQYDRALGERMLPEQLGQQLLARDASLVRKRIGRQAHDLAPVQERERYAGGVVGGCDERALGQVERQRQEGVLEGGRLLRVEQLKQRRTNS